MFLKPETPRSLLLKAELNIQGHLRVDFLASHLSRLPGRRTADDSDRLFIKKRIRSLEHFDITHLAVLTYYEINLYPTLNPLTQSLFRVLHVGIHPFLEEYGRISAAKE